MRVLFWSERFWPVIGGVGIAASKLLPALRSRGHEFAVVTSKDYLDLPEEDSYKSIAVYRFPFWTALTTRNVGQIMELRQRVVKLKRTFAPDLVHIDFLGSSILFHFHTADAYPAPLLVSTDSALPNREAGPHSLAGRALRSADWVTCVSAIRLAQACELVPEIVARSSVIHKGREVPSVPPEPLPVDSQRLLCLGRLVRIKGFDMALSAFAAIFDRYPNCRLVVAGDGPERPELERQAAELSLKDRVEFTGFIEPDNVPTLMNAVTLVVIPSRNEGLPNVAKEAALMARPVVATHVGGLPEIIVPHETGLLVEPENSGALAEAIAYLLDHPEESSRMGQTARIRVQEEFNWNRYVDAYDALYQKLARAGVGSSLERSRD